MLKSVRCATDYLPRGTTAVSELRAARRQGASAHARGSRCLTASEAARERARARAKRCITLARVCLRSWAGARAADGDGQRSRRVQIPQERSDRRARLAGRRTRCARVLARARSPVRPPGVLRPENAHLGIGGASGVCRLAHGGRFARQACVARWTRTTTVLSISTRDLGSVLRADRAVA